MTLYSEEEAAEKWCPLSRVATPVTAYPTSHVITAIASNRASKTAKDAKLTAEANPESARCIGSRCMAWRVVETAKVETVEQLSVTENKVRYVEKTTPARGYCGAFAAPVVERV